MAAKQKPLTNEEVGTMVVRKARQSVSWYDSRISKERQRTLGYYNSEYPRRQSQGSSTFVSTDVYDSVEMCKAQLVEVFGDGENIIRFDPDHLMDAKACEDATHYARWCLFRRNNGWNIMENTIHDALLSRVGVVKVYWDDDSKFREEEFSDLPEEHAMALANHPAVDTFDGTLGDNGAYSGALTRKIDASGVRVDLIAPEEFLIEELAKDIRSSDTHHRTRKRRSELIEDGYDAKIIKSIGSDDGKDLQLSPEVLERNKQVATDLALDDPIQPEQEWLTVYESYVRIQIDPEKGTRLYKVVHVNGTLLDDPQEVDRAPFIAYVPFPVPHMFYGNNFAQRVIPYQNARTVLIRGVLDHTATTTNPRWAVVKGGLINPREMMENRQGGIVNVRTPESVQPLLQPNLNPYVFQIIQELKDNKEQSTGISSLSQGLNKDAISTQNAQGLVDSLVKLSTQRQKIAARNFANFLSEVMIEILRLAIQNEKGPRWIELNGEPIQIDPRKWVERETCSVSFHLGYGDRDKMIAEMTQAFAGLAQDPGMGRMFDEPQRYAMAQDIMALRKWGNRSAYLANPKDLGPKKPNPIEVEKLKAEQTNASAEMLNAQTKAHHEMTHSAAEGAKVNQKQQQLMIDALEHDREQARKDAETSNRIDVSQQELDIARRTAGNKRQAYISPEG